MNRGDIDARLRSALWRKNGAEVLALSEAYIGDKDSHDWGLLVRGMAYELGGGGLEQDLAHAEAFYRKALVRREPAILNIYIARVLLKQGVSRRSEVLRYIKAADDLQFLPEAHLAYGATTKRVKRSGTCGKRDGISGARQDAEGFRASLVIPGSAGRKGCGCVR